MNYIHASGAYKYAIGFICEGRHLSSASSSLKNGPPEMVGPSRLLFFWISLIPEGSLLFFFTTPSHLAKIVGQIAQYEKRPRFGNRGRLVFHRW